MTSMLQPLQRVDNLFEIKDNVKINHKFKKIDAIK